MRVTARDLDTLHDLASASTMYSGLEKVFAFVRPMDCGASGGSHHHKTLQKLVAFGWAEEQRQPPVSSNGRPPGIKYRITPAGLERLKAHHSKRKVSA